MRLVLLQQHDALREALSRMLEDAGHCVIGGTGRVGNARTLLNAREAEVLLVDLRREDAAVLALIEEVARELPDIHVVAYASADDRREVATALMAGAHAAVSKEAPADELLRALAEIAAGRSWVDPRLEGPALQAAANAPLLTPREREVLELLARGMSGSEIARHLVLTPETVRSHVKSAMARLNASTRTHAVALALERAEIHLRASRSG